MGLYIHFNRLRYRTLKLGCTASYKTDRGIDGYNRNDIVGIARENLVSARVGKRIVKLLEAANYVNRARWLGTIPYPRERNHAQRNRIGSVAQGDVLARS